MNLLARLQRLQAVHRALRAGDLTAEEIAQELGCTARTIRRDVRLLREDLGAPIPRAFGSGRLCYRHEWPLPFRLEARP